MQIQEAIRLLRETCALQHLALNTEKSYAQWLVRYASFLKNPKLKSLTTPLKIEAFLTSLALSGVSASTQNQAFMAETLDRAAAVDEECYRAVCSCLYSSAVSGSKSGPVGGPMPRDVEVRDKADNLVRRFQGQPKVREFYESLLKRAEWDIRRDRKEFEERFAID